jgi:hypothetical protein
MVDILGLIIHDSTAKTIALACISAFGSKKKGTSLNYDLPTDIGGRPTR